MEKRKMSAAQRRIYNINQQFQGTANNAHVETHEDTKVTAVAGSRDPWC